MEITWVDSQVDGKKLAVRHWTVDAPKACVQLIHGLGEHGGRYAATAKALNAAGYSVFAADHRSFGLSHEADQGGLYGHFADEGGWTAARDDVLTVARACRTEGLPLVALGHSMGSFLLTATFQAEQKLYDAVILSGSNGLVEAADNVLHRLIKVLRFFRGKRAQLPLTGKLFENAVNSPFKPNRTSFDWLSRDDAQVDAYIADPLCGGLNSLQLWDDLLGGVKANFAGDGMAAVPADRPFLLFSGDRDPVGKMGAGVKKLEARLKASGASDLTVKLYADGRHEMLNETNRDEVAADVISWIDSRVG